MILIKRQLNWVECNFGLKSYLWFQIVYTRDSEITRMISDQNCTSLSSITIINSGRTVMKELLCSTLFKCCIIILLFEKEKELFLTEYGSFTLNIIGCNDVT